MIPDQNIESNQNRPIIIAKPTGKSHLPQPIIWLFSCLGGCLFFSLIIFVIMYSVLGALFTAGGSSINEVTIKDGTSQNKIAVIPVNGVILDDNQSTGLLNTDSVANATTLITMLNMASNDSTVKAIVLRENTPGGEDLATRKVCAKVKEINKNKPVYTYIENIGASGGYYLANCTRYIISDVRAQVGSIGVLATFTDTSGLLDKLGIKTKTITNTQGTQKENDIFSNNSQWEKKYKVMLDDAYTDFVNQVVEGRNSSEIKNKLTEDKVRQYATGEIFSGKEAKSLGLVDDNMLFNDAIDNIRVRESLASETKVTQYEYNSGWFGSVPSFVNKVLGNTSINLYTNSVYFLVQ